MFARLLVLALLFLAVPALAASPKLSGCQCGPACSAVCGDACSCSHFTPNAHMEAGGHLADEKTNDAQQLLAPAPASTYLTSHEVCTREGCHQVADAAPARSSCSAGAGPVRGVFRGRQPVRNAIRAVAGVATKVRRGRSCCQ